MKIETLSQSEYRQFGISMAVIFSILFGLILPWIFELNRPLWPFIVAAIFLFLAILAPQILHNIYKPWMIFGHYLGIFNTKLILTLLFIFLFVPISLILRLLGKDAMHRQWSKDKAQSYWKKSHKQSKEHMEKIY